MDDNFVPGVALGVCVGMGILALILQTFESSTKPYINGYYEAYKQFKQDKLEQSAPNNIKLRYETELLEQKYKNK